MSDDQTDHTAVEMEVVSHDHHDRISEAHDELSSEDSSSRLYSCTVSDESHQHALSWQDVTYEVDTYRGSVIKRKTGEKKRLLNGITGAVQPGTMVALMGPSGAGKSTALDVLAGRVKGSGLSGSLLINGHPRPRSMKKFSAYVMQDDTLHGVLTVRENLYYSAMLRLPSSMSHREKLGRVDNVIQELGLSHVADTKIGNIFFRGVSGGERRRVSIGVELLTCPSLLFLDEPTSGLDSKSSRMIMELILKLARGGRTVLATIHQPNSQVYGLFDKLMLLSRGEIVYFGDAARAVDFFEESGYPLPPRTNPADFFVEQINADFSSSDSSSGVSLESVRELSRKYEASTFKQQTDSAIDAIASKGLPDPRDSTAPKYNTNFFQQVGYLTVRTFKTSLRHPGIFWARLVMYTLLALLLGTLVLRMDDSADTIQDRISVLFFSVAFLSFMSVAAVPAFLEEKTIFVRERMNGYYRVGSYAFAQTVVGVPFILLIAVTFAGISYYMMNMNPAVDRFFYYILVLFLSLLVAESMVVAVSAVVDSFIVGLAIGAALFGLWMLLCGFFVVENNIPPWYLWATWLSYQKYSFQGFMYNEFMGQTYTCDTSADGRCLCPFPDLNENCVLEGEEILAYYGYDSPDDKWYWVAVLIGMALFYRLLFYVFLRFLNKGMRK
mmetsp:Transcript_47254/g.118992  ORF Transcript_47254/g.118992 Transcript_47254/m.118992 type:complete len:667 (-) Transcript_47254:105-2105(-)